jgi:hypothetical protein
MPNRDLVNTISAAPSIAPAAITSTATGSAVNMKGYNSAAVVITPGTITDGTHTPKVQSSDDGASGWADVGAANLQGSFAAIASDTIQEVGVIGDFNYLRAISTVSGATTDTGPV